MGAISNAIDVVRAREDIDSRQKAREIARIKTNAHKADFATRFTLPVSFNLSGNRRVTVFKVEFDEGLIKIWLIWTLNGVRQRFSNPWVIVNPPCLIADPGGDIVFTRIDRNTGDTITTRYREDVAQALQTLLDAQIRAA